MTVVTDVTKTGIANPIRVMGQSGAANPLTGTTTETAVATVSIPGGALGSSGSLRITALVSCTNNANLKTVSFKYGGQVLGSAAMASLASGHLQITVRNRTTASQVAWNNAGGAYGVNAASLITTRAVDSTVAQDAVISFTLATGTDTMTLEGYTVELCP